MRKLAAQLVRQCGLARELFRTSVSKQFNYILCGPQTLVVSKGSIGTRTVDWLHYCRDSSTGPRVITLSPAALQAPNNQCTGVQKHSLHKSWKNLSVTMDTMGPVFDKHVTLPSRRKCLDRAFAQEPSGSHSENSGRAGPDTSKRRNPQPIALPWKINCILSKLKRAHTIRKLYNNTLESYCVSKLVKLHLLTPSAHLILTLWSDWQGLVGITHYRPLWSISSWARVSCVPSHSLGTFSLPPNTFPADFQKWHCPFLLLTWEKRLATVITGPDHTTILMWLEP